MNQKFLKTIQERYGKKNPPQIKPGDTVRVFEKFREKEKERIQAFEGLVIATKHGAGLDGSFIVRKIAVGEVGVEKVFPLHAPSVIKVERIKSARVRRAKLYYIRERQGKKARFKIEKPNYALWEEKGAEEELEKIKEETAEAAEEKVEEKTEEDSQPSQPSSPPEPKND